jgi:hypothetical protein
MDYLRKIIWMRCIFVWSAPIIIIALPLSAFGVVRSCNYGATMASTLLTRLLFLKHISGGEGIWHVYCENCVYVPVFGTTARAASSSHRDNLSRRKKESLLCQLRSEWGRNLSLLLFAHRSQKWLNLRRCRFFTFYSFSISCLYVVWEFFTIGQYLFLYTIFGQMKRFWIIFTF